MIDGSTNMLAFFKAKHVEVTCTWLSTENSQTLRPETGRDGFVRQFPVRKRYFRFGRTKMASSHSREKNNQKRASETEKQNVEQGFLVNILNFQQKVLKWSGTKPVLSVLFLNALPICNTKGGIDGHKVMETLVPDPSVWWHTSCVSDMMKCTVHDVWAQILATHLPWGETPPQHTSLNPRSIFPYFKILLGDVNSNFEP